MGYRVVQKEVTKTVSRLADVVCDECGAKLEHTFPQFSVDAEGTWENLQAHDALEIRLIGYYGGFFDTSGEGPTVLLCKECATRLCEAFPAFRKAIEESS